MDLVCWPAERLRGKLCCSTLIRQSNFTTRQISPNFLSSKMKKNTAAYFLSFLPGLVFISSLSNVFKQDSLLDPSFVIVLICSTIGCPSFYSYLSPGLTIHLLVLGHLLTKYSHFTPVFIPWILGHWDSLDKLLRFNSGK